jgi:hypothetical protein
MILRSLAVDNPRTGIAMTHGPTGAGKLGTEKGEKIMIVKPPSLLTRER